MKKSQGKPDTLGKWVIQKYNTKLGRESEMGEIRTTKQIQEILDILGSRQLLEQARQLEREGYLMIEWKGVNTEIKALHIDTSRFDELCRREKVSNPRELFATKRMQIAAWLEEVKEIAVKEEGQAWLVSFYEELLQQMERATKELPQNARDEKLHWCLNAIAKLEGDMWKRQFSYRVLGDSKTFENVYQKKVASILSSYSDRVTDEMELDEILAEFGILSYSQTLECKGSMKYRINTLDAVGKIDITSAYYGHVLNAQTLVHSEVVDASNIRRVMTIENKANYENMGYDSQCLYIYTHGFMSRKERRFLESLNRLLDEDVEFYHWSDMDYGGIRIYQFIKERVFCGREIEPWKMRRIDYLQALNEGGGMKLEFGKRKKLEHIEVTELEELKQCILEHGLEFEQEKWI